MMMKQIVGFSLVMGFLMAGCAPESLNQPSPQSTAVPVPQASVDADRFPSSGTPTPLATAAPADIATSNFDAQQTFTSLIIDARGLPISASMSPTISSAGQEIFPARLADNLDPDFVVNEGIAVYVYGEMSEALSNPRAGQTPLIIKAMAAQGRSGVQISQPDAEHLQQARLKSDFFPTFKVIFLLDP